MKNRFKLFCILFSCILFAWLFIATIATDRGIQSAIQETWLNRRTHISSLITNFNTPFQYALAKRAEEVYGGRYEGVFYAPTTFQRVTENENEEFHANFYGVSDQFFQFTTPNADMKLSRSGVYINQKVAAKLKLKEGQFIKLKTQFNFKVHPLLVNRAENDHAITETNFRIAGIITDDQLGNFQLNPSTEKPFNIFIYLPELNRLTGENTGACNILISSQPTTPDSLTQILTFEDIQWETMNFNPKGTIVISKNFFLPRLFNHIEDAIPTLSWFANIDAQNQKSSQRVPVMGVGNLRDNAMVVSEQLAQRLGIALNDTIMLKSAVVENNEVRSKQDVFKIVHIAPTEQFLHYRNIIPQLDQNLPESFAKDPQLSPSTYVPQAIISLAKARTLWAGSHGNTSGVILTEFTEKELLEQIQKSESLFSFGFTHENKGGAFQRAMKGSLYESYYIWFPMGFLLLIAVMFLSYSFQIATRPDEKNGNFSWRQLAVYSMIGSGIGCVFAYYTSATFCNAAMYILSDYLPDTLISPSFHLGQIIAPLLIPLVILYILYRNRESLAKESLIRDVYLYPLELLIGASLISIAYYITEEQFDNYFFKSNIQNILFIMGGVMLVNIPFYILQQLCGLKWKWINYITQFKEWSWACGFAVALLCMSAIFIQYSPPRYFVCKTAFPVYTHTIEGCDVSPTRSYGTTYNYNLWQAVMPNVYGTASHKGLCSAPKEYTLPGAYNLQTTPDTPMLLTPDGIPYFLVHQEPYATAVNNLFISKENFDLFYPNSGSQYFLAEYSKFEDERALMNQLQPYAPQYENLDHFHDLILNTQNHYILVLNRIGLFALILLAIVFIIKIALICAANPTKNYVSEN